jgi:ATPase subunit of ABC transporter with duplicated ATPase domains
MDAIVELTSLGAARFGGGWSAYRDRKSMELAAIEHDLADAERRLAGLTQAAQRQSERKARKDGAGRRKAKKGDMPKILLGARKARAQETGADQARLAERRLEEAKTSAAAARARLEVVAPMSAALPATGLAPGKTVLRLEAVCAGYPPDPPVLSGLSLSVTGPERIAITGPNGAGKSTLLKVIVGDLGPSSGRVRLATPLALLDQSVSVLDGGATVLENFRRLNPQADDNSCRAALARFRFREDAALQTTATLSGGQLLRAGLACVLGGPHPPPLLILDEPTNHLDVDSIQAVESGLAAYDGALIVVSHDEVFLRNIGITRRIELGAPMAAI